MAAAAGRRREVLLAISIASCLFSIYLLYVLKVLLDDFCVVCTTFHVINFSTLVFGAVPAYRAAAAPKPKGNNLFVTIFLQERQDEAEHGRRRRRVEELSEGAASFDRGARRLPVVARRLRLSSSLGACPRARGHDDVGAADVPVARAPERAGRRQVLFQILMYTVRVDSDRREDDLAEHGYRGLWIMEDSQWGRTKRRFAGPQTSPLSTSTSRPSNCASRSMSNAVASSVSARVA